MTDQYRKVVRIERDSSPIRGRTYDATFFECGHMYRYAVDSGPPVGESRYCPACTNAARIAEKLKS